MKKHIYIFAVFIFLNCSPSKNATQIKPNSPGSGFIELEDFGIRLKPILNREYLIALCWLDDVFGSTYPEKVLEILPNNTYNESDYSERKLADLLSKSRGILYEYILNPKYLDFPLTGLSKSQVLVIEKWMSDRYNENKLIELEILEFSPYQKAEDNFVFDSYLVQQYMGQSGPNWKKMDWNDRIFLPSFRLPFETEAAYLNSEGKSLKNIKAYEFNSNDFLWLWNQYYIRQDDDSKTITLKTYYGDLLLDTNTGDKPDFETLDLLFLQDRSLELKNARYLEEIPEDFSAYPYPEKGQYGEMGFVIIGEDASGKAIIADPMKPIDRESDANSQYFVAYSKKIDVF